MYPCEWVAANGLHVYVRGAPPDGIGAFVAPLETRGSVEVYDRARFTGGTWRHVEATPLDATPETGDVLVEITTRYGRDPPSAPTKTV